jgi:hypothetical protein
MDSDFLETGIPNHTSATLNFNRLRGLQRSIDTTADNDVGCIDGAIDLARLADDGTSGGIVGTKHIPTDVTVDAQNSTKSDGAFHTQASPDQCIGATLRIIRAAILAGQMIGPRSRNGNDRES